MNTNCVSLLLAILLLFAIRPSITPAAQSIVDDQLTSESRAYMSTYLVVGDVLCLDLIYHVRLMVVFVDRDSFTPENIQLIARDLADAHTLEDLRIDFVSSEEQLGSKMNMLGEIQSFSFGNLPPRPRCGTGPGEPPYPHNISGSTTRNISDIALKLEIRSALN